MRDIKLVISDLDFTLLDRDMKLSEKSKKVINRIIDDGIEFVPCSARPYKNIPEWLRNHPKIKYVVTANGAVITNNLNKEVICSNTISIDTTKEIIEKAKDLNPHWTICMDGEFHSHDRIVSDADELEIRGSYLDGVLRDRIIESSIDFLDNYDSNTQIEKIHFITKDFMKRPKLIEIVKPTKGIVISETAPINIEIMHKNASKGNALLWIMNELNINADQVIACGDNANDISMLDVATHSVVVENATEETKKHARYIGKHHGDDGAALLIESIIYGE